MSGPFKSRTPLLLRMTMPCSLKPWLSCQSERHAPEEDRTVLLMLGRDDRLLLAYLHKSAVPSDVDTSIWRNCASLRVRPSWARFFAPRGGPRGAHLRDPRVLDASSTSLGCEDRPLL